ncbi:MAG: class I SAM-dependent methyltransferase [Candidatus Omnitrophota bacterium]|nr:class I SAM-dependent methyltransferase [Candidatus Omnitrophota bacterium]
MPACRICDNKEGNKFHIVREMMFGYRDNFEYIECAKCGCLQIKDIPAGLSRYYPNGYYSFQKREAAASKPVKSFIMRQKAKYWLYGRNVIGMMSAMGRRKPEPFFIEWFKKAGVKLNSKILDVGCGTGGLLLNMREYGFSSLTGIDPFIENDISYKNGVKIFKKDVRQLDGKYDFIVLRDSFEHMPEPVSVFKELCRLLNPDRYLLITMPLGSTFAWMKYGVNWVQLDAPRHLFLHTIESIELLSSRTGFFIKETVYDSTDFQFWGSEQYSRDITLTDMKSYMVDHSNSIFSEADILNFKARADELNKKKDGDHAAFYLYKN